MRSWWKNVPRSSAPTRRSKSPKNLLTCWKSLRQSVCTQGFRRWNFVKQKHKVLWQGRLWGLRHGRHWILQGVKIMFGHSYTGHSEWCDDNSGYGWSKILIIMKSLMNCMILKMASKTKMHDHRFRSWWLGRWWRRWSLWFRMMSMTNEHWRISHRQILFNFGVLWHGS